MFRNSLGATVIVAGVFIAPLVLAQQTSPRANQQSSARILLPIGTGYSISRDVGKRLEAMRWGFIDEQGKVVIEPRFDAVSSPNEGITAVSQNGKWGWIDQKGSFIDAQLAALAQFHEGLAWFRRDGKAGFTDVTGKIVIEPQWNGVGDFSEGLARVTQDGRDGYIETSGKIVITPRWTSAGEFHEGLAGIKENGKWGYIDRTGKVVIKPEWDNSTTFSDGFAVVFVGEKGGVIDKQGKLVVPVEWETIMPCSLFLEPILQYDEVLDFGRSQNEKRGCLDKGGKIVVDPTFEKLGGFSRRLDPKNEGGKWGLIDGTKRFVVEPQWELIIPQQIADDQVYWLVAREEKSSNGKSVLVEWRDPKGRKIWSSAEPGTR